MTAWDDLADSADRIDQQQRELSEWVADHNFRAAALGRHLHDQHEADMAELRRRAAGDDDADGM